MPHNEHGQPVGAPVTQPLPSGPPVADPMIGRYCDVVRFSAADHAADLWAEFSAAPDGSDWTYLPDEPLESLDATRAWAERIEASTDMIMCAIIDRSTGRAVGNASYQRITPAWGSIEVGYVHFGRSMQRTPLATEAMFLMMERAFDCGYRRYEWKCDALNEPSRAAAKRLGFSYEGLFRQAVVYKGRTRDTAWFSIIDTEWPAIRAEFERWLDPANFDDEGVQRTRLAM
jgi:RimJ/RimL family protein N-acetyltransferase